MRRVDMPGVDRPVYDSFPECADLLRALVRVDEQMLELCTDFDEVAAAHEASARSSGATATERAAEFHSLKIEIEAEILDLVRRWRGGET
jgi:hypothetical protein